MAERCSRVEGVVVAGVVVGVRAVVVVVEERWEEW